MQEQEIDRYSWSHVKEMHWIRDLGTHMDEIVPYRIDTNAYTIRCLRGYLRSMKYRRNWFNNAQRKKLRHAAEDRLHVMGFYENERGW